MSPAQIEPTGASLSDATAAANLVAVVYNPTKVDVSDIKRVVETSEHARGWTALWLETTSDDPGGGQATEAMEAGASVVIVAGGDGTVRAVAEVLVDTDVALCLVPSGTGNLLARNLNLAVDDLERSMSAAFSGIDRAIDAASIEIARADGSTETHTFLVMAGVGLDAKIMSNTDPELKEKVGWLAYARALATVLRDRNSLRIRYRSDQVQRRPARAQSVIVGNCGSLPANILLLPDAVLDDGLLDVVILKPESFRGWLQVIFKVFWENGIIKRTKLGRKVDGIDVDAVDFAQLPEFEVRLSRGDEIELDGDPFGEAVAFTTKVQAGALRLKVPADE
ncbi:MAG: diacylglycerol kinase [Rhodoglobus sp.]|nr:diacylglycerol kinase [Rhodoglobus sp.]